MAENRVSLSFLVLSVLCLFAKTYFEVKRVLDRGTNQSFLRETKFMALNLSNTIRTKIEKRVKQHEASDSEPSPWSVRSHRKPFGCDM